MEKTRYARETHFVPFAGAVVLGSGDFVETVVAVEILKIRDRASDTGLYHDSGRIEVRPIGLNGYIELKGSQTIVANG